MAHLFASHPKCLTCCLSLSNIISIITIVMSVAILAQAMLNRPPGQIQQVTLVDYPPGQIQQTTLVLKPQPILTSAEADWEAAGASARRRQVPWVTLQEVPIILWIEWYGHLVLIININNIINHMIMIVMIFIYRRE